MIFHPYAWTLWLAASMAAALLTRNPFYLIILLLAESFLFATIRRRYGHTPGSGASSRPMTWAPVVRLAWILWAFAILFNALTVHVGSHILFTLPSTWPLIGGPITLEAAIYGFTTGLSFVILILLFAIYNSVLGPHTILRMIPGFAYQLGVAVAIAIAFIPQTLTAWQEIREAQRLRGYRARGLRALHPLVIAILTYGLDRAIRLAESMDARGFGGRPRPLSARARWWTRGSALLGLLGLLVGLAYGSYAPASGWVGLSLLLGGAFLLGMSLWLSSRGVSRSRYRRWLWRPRDTGLILLSGLMGGAVILLAWFAPQTLFYYPYPPYPLLPSFQPWVGWLFALPLAPALLAPARQASRAHHITAKIER